MGQLHFSIYRVNSVERRELGGREFLVAPAVALVEDVVNDELILLEEFCRFPEAWIEISVQHAGESQSISLSQVQRKAA